jgi:hypothetical protein
MQYDVNAGDKILSAQFDDVQCCSSTINLLTLYIALMLLLHPHASTDQSSLRLYPVQSKAVRWQQCAASNKCAATDQMVSKFVVHWRLLLFFINHCIQQAQHDVGSHGFLAWLQLAMRANSFIPDSRSLWRD